jgi:hypothetical protein
MRTIIISGLLIITMTLAQTLHAQTANDVVNKYIAAMGGREKLTSLKTVKMEASLTVQGTNVTLVITKKHLTGMRMDISVMGTENYQIITPAKGTIFMPVQGMSEPTAMPDEQLKAGQSQLDLEGTLVNYEDKGTTLELAGHENVDGEDCYSLKVTANNGVTTNYFISANTSYIVKTSGKRVINGEEMDISTTYSNYKQNADGYWFPYTSTNMQGTTDFAKIDTNVPVDESIFNQ